MLQVDQCVHVTLSDAAYNMSNSRKYLEAPSTSVSSEHLVIAADKLYSDSRTQMAPHKAEKLLFI